MLFVKSIPIKSIVIEENYRTNIEKTELNELMQSIKQNGLLQNIGVIDLGGGKYKLRFGARRLLAYQKLGHTHISAEIRKKSTNIEFIIDNLSENLQRKDPSFAELGRGVERLIKEGLDFEQMEVRLGIPKAKLQGYYRAYKDIPAKHRDKVSFLGKGGGDRKDVIPASIAMKVAEVRRHLGLPEKIVDKIFEYVQEHELTAPQLETFAVFLKQGLEIDQAVAKMLEYNVYTVQIVAHRGKVQRIMQEKEIVSSAEYLRQVIYGELPPVEKPSFLKKIEKAQNAK